MLGPACGQPARATSDGASSSFAVDTPVVTDAVYEREYVADIRARRRVEVRPRTKGFIESVPIDEGQTVTRGQVLFTISIKSLKQQHQIARAAVRRAAADLKTAQLERTAIQALFDKGVVSEAELALASSKIASLEAQLAEARATRDSINLEYASVVAPFAGVVNRIPLRTGSVVDDSVVLTTLTDTSEVLVYFRVSEAEYLEYSATKAGLPRQVWLRLADGSMHPDPGVVDAVETEFDPETGSLALRARFPNEEGRLKSGSTGTVVVKTSLDAALIVPQKSTFEVQEQLYVYVVDAENTARARRIVPRLRLEDGFVIASGLEKTEHFVVDGVQKVRDGMRVEPIPQAAATGT